MPGRAGVSGIPVTSAPRSTDAASVHRDRRILIVDSPSGELQQLAMELLGRGFEVHYASDLDEAYLLARETDGQIHAVLFTPGPQLERVPDLASRFGVTPEALIPVGPRPATRVVRALAHHGVLWQLWDDPPDESIRFVISGVLHDHDPTQLRYHMRVPTTLAATYEFAGRKVATTIRDVALGGACLVGGPHAAEGEDARLRFEVGSRSVSLPTRTVWTAPDENEALSVAGVRFLEVDAETGEVLDELLRSVVARHRIAPAS